MKICVCCESHQNYNMLTEKQNNTKFLPHQHKAVSGQKFRVLEFRIWNTLVDVTKSDKATETIEN